MADEPQDQESVPARGNGRMLAIGGSIAAAAVIGIAFASGGRDVVWSDSGQPAQPLAKPAAVQNTAPKPAAGTMAPDVIRGIIQSQAQATIASRMTARIVYMPYRVGESFPKGAPLARFDCSTLRAQLNAANAATQAYRKTYDTNVELDLYQAVGKNDVEVSKANLGKASAEARAIASELQDCAVHAPFSGRVVEEIAHAHEVAASGQPLMKIENSGSLEVQLIVPSRWLTWLKPGTPFAFKVDETGEMIEARIVRLGAAVDPVSKTLRVIGSLGSAKNVVLPGMSGTASFDEAQARGDTT